MDSKIYCFASAKGGSGKTIISASLGEALAYLGEKILLIDADGSTNGMTLLYLQQVIKARNSAEQSAAEPSGIFDGADSNFLAVELEQKGLWFLPATFSMKETHEVSADIFDRSLQAAISKYEREFDFIIIDAQAGIEDFALAAMKRSDQIVIASEYDPSSKKGIERFKKMAISKETPWVLFNKVLPEFMEKIGDPLGISDLLPPIPWNANVVRAYVKGTLALDMDMGNVYTLGLLRTAGVLFGRDVQVLVEGWRADKDDFIRAPKRTQLEKIVNELDEVQRKKVRAEYEATRGGSINNYFWIIIAVLAAIFFSLYTYTSFKGREVSTQYQKVITSINSLEKSKYRTEDEQLKLSALYKERDKLEKEKRTINVASFVIYGMSGIICVVLIIFYLWYLGRWQKRKLMLLEEAAIYAERIDELRMLKSQQLADEQLSLDELIKRNT